MDQIRKLCIAANLLVELESSYCFNKRTSKRMDLVVNLNERDVLVDVTTVDPNNPSNAFIKDLELTTSYFPGAAAVMKARSKFMKYRGVMAPSKEFVPFVLETQGRWGPCEGILQVGLCQNSYQRLIWQLKISLAYMRATITNIIHRFHTIRKNAFDPAAHQDFFFFLFVSRAELVSTWTYCRVRVFIVFFKFLPIPIYLILSLFNLISFLFFSFS